MIKRTCSVEGCEKTARSRGWCPMHYTRWARHQDTNIGFDSVEERFWAKVQKTDTCWLWTAGLAHGYGSFRLIDRAVYAHRMAYELMVGPIPEGLHLDHLCRVTNCVNPEHLEPVTCRENNLRGISPAAVNAAKTHCPQGHQYSAENTYENPNSGRRLCRACQRVSSNARSQRAA